MNKAILFIFFILITDFSNSAFGQESQNNTPNGLEGYQFRSIGPSRGGRVTTVTGVLSNPHKFYMGSTGGGVWTTDDAGNTWRNISDGYFNVGSIGAISVAPSDENIIYVGTGSGCPRGNISMGDGIYKSMDKGKTWKHIGLPKAGLIGNIVVDPKDENIVYVAVMGNPFGPNPERGVYKSIDGGTNWDQVFAISTKTGAVDLVMHPTNRRILFAGMWTVERKPWTLVDGSNDGGIWKSSDAGETWTKVEGGLPSGLLGRIGLTISPANTNLMWAIIETAVEQDGGIYRSEDGGSNWKKINRNHNLRQRAWYYNHIEAHPTQENTLYVMNAGFYKSIDGGNSFSRVSTPHGDNHDLWINPIYPKIMIEANDGGACVTLNDCKSWSSIYNQPTAEFYRLTVDNQFPYRVYGAQQDNSTISVPSKPQKYLDPIQEWYSVGGGESGHIAVDPENPDLIYAGNYIGQIDRTDLIEHYRQDIVAYPQMHDGTEPRNIKFRFQWNAPIYISPHDRTQVFHCSQYVHRTFDGGQNWEIISPDLTTDTDSQQDIPGGPIQHDHTGVELYNTIFTFVESPHQAGEYWAGSDDGLIHLSMDHGENWINITPKLMPEQGTVNTIELSTHDPKRAYIAVYKYRDNDFRPYIFTTDNRGKSWTLLTSGDNGIPVNHFVRVVREDPWNDQILYAGTEFGLYISFDQGKQWHAFQNNLPRTPITDMLIHQNDLVIATQGRSFWILDNVRSISHLNPLENQTVEFYVSDTIYRSQYGRTRGPGIQRAPTGAIFDFFLPDDLSEDDQFLITIKDEDNSVRRTFSNKANKEKGIEKLKANKGVNRVEWNLRYEGPKAQPKSVFSLASMSGIKAPPSAHTVEIKLNDKVISRSFDISIDPRWTHDEQDLIDLYRLTMEVKALFNRTHETIGDMRSFQSQFETLKQRTDLKNQESIQNEIEKIEKACSSLENTLIQNKSESGQDPINYPSQVDDQIAYLYSNLNSQDHKPSAGARERLDDLRQELKPHFEEAARIQQELEDLK